MSPEIVCDTQVFNAEERAAQLARGGDAIVRWPCGRQELPDGYLLEYQGDETLFLRLAQFVAEEHRCCAWLSFALEMDPGQPAHIRLRLTAPAEGEGKAFLTAAFDYLAGQVTDADPDYRKLAEQIVGTMGPRITGQHLP